MEHQISKYRRPLFVGIVLIAMGVVFSNIMSNKFGSLGIVLIAVGGLFFIIGMNEKRKEENRKNQKINTN